MDKYYIEAGLGMDKVHEDPWATDYSTLSTHVFKLVLRSKLPLIHEKTKVHMLRNWVARNSFLSHQAAVFDMLRCIDLKELSSSMTEVTSLVRQFLLLMDNVYPKCFQVNSWPLTEEQFSTFSSLVSAARRAQEEESDKRKRMRLSSRFGDPEEWTERQRDFFQRHPQLLERHRELVMTFRLHSDLHPDLQGPGVMPMPGEDAAGGQVEAGPAMAEIMMDPDLEFLEAASDDSDDVEFDYFEVPGNEYDHEGELDDLLDL